MTKKKKEGNLRHKTWFSGKREKERLPQGLGSQSHKWSFLKTKSDLYKEKWSG